MWYPVSCPGFTHLSLEIQIQGIFWESEYQCLSQYVHTTTSNAPSINTSVSPKGTHNNPHPQHLCGGQVVVQNSVDVFWPSIL